MNNAMTKHEQFILDELLPLLFTHSAKVNCDPVETALAVLMTMGAILQEKGLSDAFLFSAIRGNTVNTHDAPELFQ